MSHLDLITAPQTWVFLFAGLAFYVFRWSRKGKASKTSLRASPPTNPKAEYSEKAYYQIDPLPDFNLSTTEPLKLRPFKPTYNLTMAIQNTTLSDLLAFDKTYLPRLSIRKSLLATRPHDVLAYNPICEPAIHELYTWLITAYLPLRHPTLFSLTAGGLENRVTGKLLPLTPSSTESALRMLGENIDTDFLILLPNPPHEAKNANAKPEDEVFYRLEGFITCFPSGFDTKKKLGMKLAEIHGPVPSYKERLEKSMDKFFAQLPVGKIIKRHNWSITTTRDLYLQGGTHLTPEDIAARKSASSTSHPSDSEDTIDLTNTVLRCERQTLHRLPNSKAIVFGYKTYQYDLQELRDEGVGPELAEASEGLGKGNAPGMRVYKREVVWGEAVRGFLRGEMGV